jgi:hypothetical protein
MNSVTTRRRSGWIGYLRGSIATFNTVSERQDPLLPRGLERLLLRFLGRPIECTECGQTIFRGRPVVWRGQLLLIGAHQHVVRVSFASSDTMQFRHAYAGECPSPERPWIE